jgi:hypothetical protein
MGENTKFFDGEMREIGGKMRLEISAGNSLLYAFAAS